MYTSNWDNLQQPNKVEVDSESLTSSYGKFTVEPLEKGFGITMGHTLRRVLLSSLQGCAAIAVKIEGVAHEFEAINGIHEDVVQILLNLKSMQMRQLSEGIHELELVGAGPYQLKAKDIVTGGQVEILNPEQVIATLDDGAELEMRIFVTLNKGYVTAEENQSDELPADVIYLDSVHTPIKRINYEVQNARVGQKTDFDRLLFEVWTNGAINPGDGLAYAAKIIKEHMNIFINFDDESMDMEGRSEPDLNAINDNLHRPVSELELSVRSINCLQNAKIETIGELVQKTENEMLKTKNFGGKSLNEIKHILNTMGLHLGMKLDKYDAKPPTGEEAGTSEIA